MKRTHKKVTAPLVVNPPTIIEFLLDETGSMQSYLHATLNGFRQFVDEQRSQDGECLFTLTKFDTRGFRTPYTDLDIHAVPYLTQETFLPGQMTNLRDSILHRVRQRNELLTQWDIKPRVMFVCLTDGADNASSASVAKVKEQIQETNDWAFIYLGAYPGADVYARQLGFPEANTRCFAGEYIQEKMQELSTATKAYRAGSSSASNIYG